MIHIPNLEEQISICKCYLYIVATKETRKKITPQKMTFYITDEAFKITVKQILKEPLSEMELYFFNKNVLKKNKELLINQ
jgi:hypothetical protein